MISLASTGRRPMRSMEPAEQVVMAAVHSIGIQVVARRLMISTSRNLVAVGEASPASFRIYLAIWGGLIPQRVAVGCGQAVVR